MISSPPLLLASTSPQRRAILEQLGLPFEVVAPRYEERDDDGLVARGARACTRRRQGPVGGGGGGRPARARRRHRGGRGRPRPRKARGRARGGGDARRSWPGGRTWSSPASACWRRAGRPSSTRRRASRSGALAPREVDAYVATGEWRGPRRRLCDPVPRRGPGRADRGRLPERRRPPGRPPRPPPRRPLPRRLRHRLARPRPGVWPRPWPRRSRLWMAHDRRRTPGIGLVRTARLGRTCPRIRRTSRNLGGRRLEPGDRPVAAPAPLAADVGRARLDGVQAR